MSFKSSAGVVCISSSKQIANWNRSPSPGSHSTSRSNLSSMHQAFAVCVRLVQVPLTIAYSLRKFLKAKALQKLTEIKVHLIGATVIENCDRYN